MSKQPDPRRAEAMAEFLQRAGWGRAERRLLAGDASFRKYYRVDEPQRHAVLMDAPPPQENVRPFVTVAEHLLKLGFSAPRLLAKDVEHGFLLLEDLGDDTYTRKLAAGADENTLYAAAVDVLIALHRHAEAAKVAVPPYDDERLLTEAALLTDWYLPALTGQPTPAALREEYLAIWKPLLARARHDAPTLVLRDYHVDNLMWLEGRGGVASCGLLDFQDAVTGPAAYDLVSLLEDARRDVPAALAEAMMTRYLAAFPDIDRDAFRAAYAILGAQRNAKIVGIFTRLMVRDGKPQYLKHIPRVWRLLSADVAHPALAPMRDWLARIVPPERRIIPPALAA
jgi:aminoglycoside/choline kinase family phosphotransferase